MSTLTYYDHISGRRRVRPRVIWGLVGFVLGFIAAAALL